MSYNSDREFTDYVHDKLAIPIIYNKMQWKPYRVSNDDIEYHSGLDLKDGVDYKATTSNGRTITIQERFRDNFYAKYDDFTIRYTRTYNKYDSRRKSEFFKMTANYLIYGITNGKKFPDQRHTLTDFLKYAVIDLVALGDLYDTNRVILPHATGYTGGNFSRIVERNGKKVLMVGFNLNPDRSSEFISIRINDLHTLLSADFSKVVKLQHGFL